MLAGTAYLMGAFAQGYLMHYIAKSSSWIGASMSNPDVQKAYVIHTIMEAEYQLSIHTDSHRLGFNVVSILLS